MANEIVESANNPANEKTKREKPAGWIPMSVGIQKLTVPEKDGFKRRWFRGDPGRIAKARQAGYTHVQAQDVDLNNFSLGSAATGSGNTDLGGIVSVISGDEAGPDGQPGRLYLMECPIEWYEESRRILEDRNDEIVDALTQGTMGGTPKDHQYTSIQKDKALPDLFKKNKTSRRF